MNLYELDIFIQHLIDNDENELVATAKLSKPLKKTFSREATIRVKLDY